MNISKMLLLGATAFTLNAQSQSISMMGGAPEGVIFRGYENVIQVDDNLAENRKFQVEFVGGEIKTIQPNDGTVNKGRYLLYPGTAKSSELIVRDNEGNEMNRMSFSVSFLPENDIVFATVDGAFSFSERKIIVQNKAFPYFEKTAEITGWEITVDGKFIGEGRSNYLTDEVMAKLKNMPLGTTFTVKTLVMDDKGVTRIRSIESVTNY